MDVGMKDSSTNVEDMEVSVIINGEDEGVANSPPLEEAIDSSLIIEKVAMLIQEGGNRLHCPITTVAKSLLIYHHFQKLTNGNHFDDCSLAVAVLSLGIKVCDDDIKCEDIVLVFYHMKMDGKTVPNPARPDPPREKIQELKRSLVKSQYLVCTVMSYKLDFEIAHEYVFPYLSQLQSASDVDDPKIGIVSLAVTKLLSTFYLSKRCIDYAAADIAVACARFAFLYSDFDLPPLKNLIKKEFGVAFAHNEQILDVVDSMIMVADVATAFISMT